MRGTIHLVSARDCLPLRRLVQPVIERGMRGAFGKQLAGVDPRALATKRLYTINGVIPGSVLIDGFVAGMWRLTRSRAAATVTIELFGPVRERHAVAAEAERVLAFGAPDLACDVRFAPLAQASASSP